MTPDTKTIIEAAAATCAAATLTAWAIDAWMEKRRLQAKELARVARITRAWDRKWKGDNHRS